MAKRKKENKYSLDLVVITWRDAEASCGWESNMDTVEYVVTATTPVISVGFLFSKPDKENPYYLLVGDLDETNKNNNRRMIIPDKWVQNVEVLREKSNA